MPDSKKIDAWNPILFVAIALNEAKGACLGWDPSFFGTPSHHPSGRVAPNHLCPMQPSSWASNKHPKQHKPRTPRKSWKCWYSSKLSTNYDGCYQKNYDETKKLCLLCLYIASYRDSKINILTSWSIWSLKTTDFNSSLPKKSRAPYWLDQICNRQFISIYHRSKTWIQMCPRWISWLYGNLSIYSLGITTWDFTISQ